jgi:phosphatidylinositol glycan class V
LPDAAVYLSKNGRLVTDTQAYSHCVRLVRGALFPQLAVLIISVLTRYGLTSTNVPEALTGILLASTCHLLSVVVLYKLSQRIFSDKQALSNQDLSWLVAALHIINPAGAFLAAPYGEPVFSLFNFAGLYVYLDGTQPSDGSFAQGLKLVVAGVLFGVATSIRSNGILSGMLFAYDAIINGLQLLRNGMTIREIQKLSFLVLGGSLIAFGMILPQYLAYSEYCLADRGDIALRPWCSSKLPSIYSWVQSHYW